MAETVLKFSPETKAPSAPSTSTSPGRKGGRLRWILLVVIPLIALAGGLVFYLSGGRYISTDNAYIGAQKVLITPDISGKVARVTVKEGQHVNAGDELFVIDPAPFQFALQQAQSKLDAVRTDFANLKSNLKSLTTLVDLAQKNVDLKQHDVDRKRTLLASRAVSQADVDTSLVAVVTAQLQLQLGAQQQATTLNQLLGNPDLPIEQFPGLPAGQGCASIRCSATSNTPC